MGPFEQRVQSRAQVLGQRPLGEALEVISPTAQSARHAAT
jgi:hypothetical protein